MSMAAYGSGLRYREIECSDQSGELILLTDQRIPMIIEYLMTKGYPSYEGTAIAGRRNITENDQ